VISPQFKLIEEVSELHFEVAESLIADKNHIHSYIDSGDSNHRPAHEILQGGIVNEGGKGEEMDGRHQYAELVEDL
jgi:hypothetical protein